MSLPSIRGQSSFWRTTTDFVNDPFGNLRTMIFPARSESRPPIVSPSTVSAAAAVTEAKPEQFKVENYLARDNTALHNAIIANNTKKALENIRPDTLNVASLGNTPLILAFKRGNMVVARELLKQQNINVDAEDEHGLTAMHWACMLRQDDLILALLKKGANPHHIAKKWANPDISEGSELSPIWLYSRKLLCENLWHYYVADTMAFDFQNDIEGFRNQNPLYTATFFKGRIYMSGFADRPDLHIPGEMAYTDIVFHIDALCTNLRWVEPNIRFVTLEETRSTASMFKHNFGAGIPSFCKHRNAIPVSEQVLSAMVEHRTPALQPKL